MVGRDTPLLRVSNLRKVFPAQRSLLDQLVGAKRAVHAVNGITFAIGQQETFGLVGESGSGKSTTGKLIARLIKPTAGEVELAGENWFGLSAGQLRRRRREIQMIFQNPFLSLDPRWSAERIIAEPLATHGVVPRRARRQRVAELLTAVGLNASHAQRYPHQFSGGQRQRIGLARALASRPRLLIADEPVSALDVSVQAQILNLLQEIKRDFQLSMLFISHDLSVVRYLCDRVGVMYLGRLVEVADTSALYKQPQHPYTQALLSAIPVPSARNRRRFAPLPGEIPSPIDPPSGCHFHPRCPRAAANCGTDAPPLRQLSHGHWVACHFPGPPNGAKHEVDHESHHSD